jgi:N-acetylmuramoyl-L-alanine amidase
MEDKPVRKGAQSGTAGKSLRIIIDPGHGGRDTGAIGPNGVEEKTVTLAIAKRLARELQDDMGATVYLTRSRDVDLPLEKRNALANAKKADLFISIHANANRNRKVSGIETYYLNNASDEAAKRLAQRENKSAEKPQSQVDKILLTLSQNYTTEESRVFAGDVHKTVIDKLSGRYKGLKDLKVRSALFYVLVGAKCPGILVETSFISNPLEEKRLTNPAYQSAVADAIASGIERYVKTDKDRLATL